MSESETPSPKRVVAQLVGRQLIAQITGAAPKDLRVSQDYSQTTELQGEFETAPELLHQPLSETINETLDEAREQSRRQPRAPH